MSQLPWVEKYRPNNLDDIISHTDIINTLTNLITNNKLPHLIFYGPPGTGKTTTILACAKKIYGSYSNSMLLELNGSDDRGINVVREQIKNFSATDSKIGSLLIDENINTNVKLVILDEADAMTYDAQFALRRVVEQYTNSTRFCLICNYLTKIIHALQSRCQMFRFAPIKYNEHLIKINNIVKLENININDKAIEKIIELSEGDMRKSLNLLQSLFMIKNNELITLESVYKSIGYPTDIEREDIITSFNNQNLNNTYEILKKLQLLSNFSNQDIIREVTTYYSINKIKNKEKILNLFDELAKIEINISNNTNNNIQLLAISSIIYKFNN
jgi:replication factor C subunit 3/5